MFLKTPQTQFHVLVMRTKRHVRAPSSLLKFLPRHSRQKSPDTFLPSHSRQKSPETFLPLRQRLSFVLAPSSLLKSFHATAMFSLFYRCKCRNKCFQWNAPHTYFGMEPFGSAWRVQRYNSLSSNSSSKQRWALWFRTAVIVPTCLLSQLLHGWSWTSQLTNKSFAQIYRDHWPIQSCNTLFQSSCIIHRDTHACGFATGTLYFEHGLTRSYLRIAGFQTAVNKKCSDSGAFCV